MSEFVSSITNINPAYPVRPAQPGKRDKDRNGEQQPPKTEPPPAPDDAGDEPTTIIDEHA